MTIQYPQGPVINNSSLKTEMVFKGINLPTSMAFLGPNDILVLEKNEGTVKRIINGTMLPQPLLHVNVDNKAERGMLGIAIAKHKNVPTYVFLYYTEAGVGNTADKCNGFYIIIFNCTEPAPKDGEDIRKGDDPVCACIYRYELVDNKLVNPKLLLNLSAKPGFYITPDHVGGKILIGPDQNVYVVIGDVGGHMTQALNIKGGSPADGTGGILRITQDGEPVKGNILGDNFPVNLYYAYGIRNSFGMDFDPLTKKLWDTENGPSYGDEINLVEPGFNSGWINVQAIWKPSEPNNYFAGNIILHPDNLTDFGGKGKYRAPEFMWNNTVSPTALKFLNSDKLGKQYENDMFVGDFDNGNLYDFKLNRNRTKLSLDGPLTDKVANSNGELQGIIFGQGFGGITDIDIGPDGYLYILSLHSGGDDCNYLFPNVPCVPYSSSIEGSIFRIVPVNKAVIP
jgi:glucose/arabinose dehydrogenase